jgi:hypothetical protein
MSEVREDGRNSAHALWVSAEPDQLASIARQVRELNPAAATAWLDGFFQGLGPRDGPNVESRATLFSAGRNVAISIEDYVFRSENGLRCRLVGQKPERLKAKIRREIESRSRIPRDAIDRPERARAIALLCQKVIDHISAERERL